MLRPDTLWLLLFLFFFCGTIIVPIIDLLLHPGLDYLIITTLLYTFTCRAVTVSYFFNTTASNTIMTVIKVICQWSLMNSQSFHPINNLLRLISPVVFCPTCDLWHMSAADKQATRLMCMKETVRTDCVLPEPQLPDWMSLYPWRGFTPNYCWMTPSGKFKVDKTKVKSGWRSKMFDGFTEIYT